MADTYHSINLHIIFSCKDRMPLITPEIEAELYHVIGGILRNKDCVLIEGNGTADHSHLLIGLPPKYAPSEIMRDIKSNSSRWVHEKWPKSPFGWQDGYGVFSVSISKIPRTREYILSQKEHHRKTTFREELQWFLDNHGVQYDPKFLPAEDVPEGPMPPPSGARDSDPM
jgi:putative transposase